MSATDRIRWRCRRGMLELDVLLERFNRDHLPHLDAGQQARYAELLALPDRELYDLLMGGAPPDWHFAVLLDLMGSPQAAWPIHV
ncbi:MAG TPA: succinate dehydrogenase assembly factor 2 [Burkholderiales bacterium]|nr:succinate dehydrogenase assembly factor 2 [Burkholderiales bacterium]